MKRAEFVVSLQYKKEHLSEAILIAKEHRYADYFKFYRESDLKTPRGFPTWREYCQGASPEAAHVMEIEQFRNDYRGLLPDEVLTAIEVDLTEAKTHLFKEDVDYLQNRYYIPVQHGGVYYFRQHYNYNQLPTLATIAGEIFKYHDKLASDVITAVRYERASLGARILMAYLAWCKGNKSAIDRPDSAHYRAALFGWLTARDFAYVLQFEFHDFNVALIKEGMALALERQTDPKRLSWLRARAKRFIPIAKMTEDGIKKEWPADCFFSAMAQGNRLFTHRIFTGKNLPPQWPFNLDDLAYHRWHKLHDEDTRKAISAIACQLAE